MCGIAGVVGPGAERHHEALERMLYAVEHCGPDEGGRWSEPGALLGFDEWPSSTLPMAANPSWTTTLARWWCPTAWSRPTSRPALRAARVSLRRP